MLPQFKLISQHPRGEPTWVMIVVGLCLFVFILFLFIPGQQGLHNAALIHEKTQRFIIKLVLSAQK